MTVAACPSFDLDRKVDRVAFAPECRAPLRLVLHWPQLVARALIEVVQLSGELVELVLQENYLQIICDEIFHNQIITWKL